MTDSEIVREIDFALERQGLRVEIEAYGPPLEETLSKEALELWRRLGCAGEDNSSQVIAIAQCDAPESLKRELIHFFLDVRKDMAEDKVCAYKTIAEWWWDCTHEDETGANPVSESVTPEKAKVCEAVTLSFNDYKKKGLQRQAAMEQAIADNIADIRALGLWRANKGHPDEGEPGSSWKACYQTLYEKGYLKQ